MVPAWTLRDRDQLLAQAASIKGKNVVYGRVSPSQKLTLVEGLRAVGAHVMYVGDGVNDMPAVRGADVGVAVGVAAVPVTKEAADVLLFDPEGSLRGLLHAILAAKGGGTRRAGTGATPACCGIA